MAVPPGWERRPVGALVELPDRAVAVTASTGDELVVWSRSAGARYDPLADRWRMIALAPVRHRQAPAVAWTGREVLVWGGVDGTEPLGDGAAYDPATDRWRPLAPAPLGARTPAVAAWTGRELVVGGGRAGYGGMRARDVAAYDPSTDTWRSLPDLPLDVDDAVAAWTGREVLVYGFDDRFTPRAAAYDPATDRWRLAATPLLGGVPTRAAWAGRQLVAWDMSGRSAAYDPDRDAWRRLPSISIGTPGCGPGWGVQAGRTLFVEACAAATVLSLDDEERGWSPLAHPEGVSARPHVVGGAVVLWDAGGPHPGTWVYGPPARPA